MTVINEHDSDGQLQYMKMMKVEFLEFIARISELLFEDSEMDSLPLAEKVEHVLDEILPLVNEKRIKQVITV